VDRSAGWSAVEDPEQLLCPITHTMFRDPVFVPESGNTYERSAVEQYWATSPPPRDPLTNVALSGRTVHPNWMVRREVQRFLDTHPDYTPQGWLQREVPGSGSAPKGSTRHSAASWGLYLLGRCAMLVALLTILLAAACWQADFVMFAIERERQLAGGSESAATVPLRNSSGEVLRAPRGSSLRVSLHGDTLVAELPPSGTSGDALPQLFFAVFWLAFTGCWTYGAVSGGAPLIFTAFSMPFWGVGGYMLVESLRDASVGELLEVGPDYYRTCSTFLSWERCSERAWVADLSGPPLRECTGDSTCKLVFEEEGARLNFEFGGSSLSDAEAKWLQGKILGHLPVYAGDRTDLPKRIVEVPIPVDYGDYGI